MTGVRPPTGSIAISRHGGKRATRAVHVEEAHEMDFVTRARLNALLAHDANPADQAAPPLLDGCTLRRSCRLQDSQEPACRSLLEFANVAANRVRYLYRG